MAQVYTGDMNNININNFGPNDQVHVLRAGEPDLTNAMVIPRDIPLKDPQGYEILNMSIRDVRTFLGYTDFPEPYLTPAQKENRDKIANQIYNDLNPGTVEQPAVQQPSHHVTGYEFAFYVGLILIWSTAVFVLGRASKG